eukprot:CAMPEP_0202404432 /NCGR_PEP_ID=MMETSP1128-20130828/5674_1 /ASSEMBLY_ACC=CAM_ASM_000463 /TAXON_ID=3047 /ORGANISM="Dunaliella tertiolecta, Strain CCMP1320" /LENGTH=87 /DNA_ID=CAMNT_0049008907 /DNA_START=732 /DNA_END=992 /DNA_ORIENTATION=-
MASSTSSGATDFLVAASRSTCKALDMLASSVSSLSAVAVLCVWDNGCLRLCGTRRVHAPAFLAPLPRKKQAWLPPKCLDSSMLKKCI